MRYYYKDKQGHPAYNIKEPIESLLGAKDAKKYVEITKAEWDELTYVAPYQPTAEEIAKQQKMAQISSLKAELAQTDYVVIKIAESDDAEEIAALRSEYADVIAHRKAVRAQINQLESEL